MRSNFKRNIAMHEMCLQVNMPRYMRQCRIPEVLLYQDGVFAAQFDTSGQDTGFSQSTLHQKVQMRRTILPSL